MVATWNCSANDLVALFRRSLTALVPVAEDAHMPWKRPNKYDDWENIEAGLYRSFVAMAIENTNAFYALRTAKPLAPYAMILPGYSEYSFLSVSNELRQVWAFLDLDTEQDPFDTIRYVTLDAALVSDGAPKRLPLGEAQFSVAFNNGGCLSTIPSLEVVL
jgi:hypothetical protein